ncbi:HNH endonuclease [Pseudonocardiaceae bacterium YIM PH 21723]|nr:HNH endonuclease [Pseudonocardiaceae bacterium YIM PH 21723]
MRTLRTALVVTAMTAAAVMGVATPALATPPGIPSKATAQGYLNGITEAPEGPQTGYSREKFKHWITISGSCDTRETVLKRDGSNVVTNSSCSATSGSWFSPYDGATWTAASDVDIDHVVPLSEAWKSGASGWTDQRRQDFANDLSRPQLIAVTDNVNQAKGDKDPAAWKPPLTSYYCTYAKMWVTVKNYYGLTAQPAEKSALQSMLNSCSA